METFFAPAQRADEKLLREEIEFVSKNVVITGLLHSISGLLAVVDEHRQILAVNDSFLQMLGIDDPGHALGLRPGEALRCPHAKSPPSGCGTTKYCASCGAAIAMVTSLEEDKPVEKVCALTLQKNGNSKDIALRVKSQPVKFEDKRFLLLFIQDITYHQQLAALERTFFHDVGNMLSFVVGASETLTKDFPSELSDTIHQTMIRLRKEVAIQKCLSNGEYHHYQPLWYPFTSKEILERLKTFFLNHPTAEDKIIEYRPHSSVISIKTDLSLILRILCNMVINALEATKINGKVKVWLDDGIGSLSFYVWNDQPIPEKMALRIFQRNYSTKKQPGRGMGTYAMKLFGEKVLGGRVSFTSSKEDGTLFRFDHPL